MASTTATASAICALNDQLRRNMKGGIVVFTPGAMALGQTMTWRILHAVATFDAFDTGNDPYGEHDFGTVLIDDKRLFWKIDYYDRSMQRHSPNPADAAVTERVLTIMLASEY